MLAIGTAIVFALPTGVVGTGCDAPPPLLPPPTVQRDGEPQRPDERHNRVVVIGLLQNPARASVAWNDIGQGMSKALAQTILNRGEVDVWIDARLSQRIERILAGPVEQQPRELRKIKSEHQNLRWVIVGSVTDFSHSSDLPPDVVSHREPSAIVAVQFDVIDVDAMRIVISDHVLGIAPSKDTPVDELYAGVAFGSYVFWNTPLGRAAAKSLEGAMARLDELLPESPSAYRIAERLDSRRVRITGRDAPGLKTGSEWVVCLSREDSDLLTVVVDPVTREPVIARILSTGRSDAIAILRGLPPEDVNWSALVLRKPVTPAVDQQAAVPLTGTVAPSR